MYNIVLEYIDVRATFNNEMPSYFFHSCVFYEKYVDMLFFIPFILIAFLLCQIMKEIQEHKIKIYEFPDTEDEEDNKLIRKIKVINYSLHTVYTYIPTSNSSYS